MWCQWYLPLVRQSCLKKIKSYLLVCKIFLRDTMNILKCVNAAFLGWDSRQMSTPQPEKRGKGKSQGLGPNKKSVPTRWLQGWSLWHCMKQHEYREIKGLVVGLIAMQLHGFSLLWKKNTQRQSNYSLSFLYLRTERTYWTSPNL